MRVPPVPRRIERCAYDLAELCGRTETMVLLGASCDWLDDVVVAELTAEAKPVLTTLACSPRLPTHQVIDFNINIRKQQLR
jgi:hypothetical protein